jgi:hypothetical protein
MKKNNPTTPILIREAHGTLPRVFARYGPYHPPLYDTSAFATDIANFQNRVWQGEERVIRRHAASGFYPATFWKVEG